MVQLATSGTRHASAPIARASRWPRRIAVAGLLVLGAGALAGGVALAGRPDGSVMHFDVALLAGSPFADYFLPGLILGGLFGAGSLAAAALGLRGSRLAPPLAFIIGVGQMIWIVVELAVIQEFSFLQPAMFALGAVIATAAVAWDPRTALLGLWRR